LVCNLGTLGEFFLLGISLVREGERRENRSMIRVIDGSRYRTILRCRKLSNGFFTDRGIVVNPKTGFRTTIASGLQMKTRRAALRAGVEHARTVKAF
jgi:hypothetical protein